MVCGERFWGGFFLAILVADYIKLLLLFTSLTSQHRYGPSTTIKLTPFLSCQVDIGGGAVPEAVLNPQPVHKALSELLKLVTKTGIMSIHDA